MLVAPRKNRQPLPCSPFVSPGPLLVLANAGTLIQQISTLRRLSPSGYYFYDICRKILSFTNRLMVESRRIAAY